MKSKIILGCVALVCILASLGFVVFNHSNYPEKAIVGEWEEVSWVYELSDEENSKNITSEERYSIANHLVIHEFEHWIFDQNFNLILKDKYNRKHKAKWNLKGRGHILNLINSDKSMETYSIEELGKDEMVLHFQTDVQARGIIKITLKKIKSHAS